MNLETIGWIVAIGFGFVLFGLYCVVMGLCEIDKVLREIRDTAQTIQSDAEGAASSLSAYNRRAGV